MMFLDPFRQMTDPEAGTMDGVAVRYQADSHVLRYKGGNPVFVGRFADDGGVQIVLAEEFTGSLSKAG